MVKMEDFVIRPLEKSEYREACHISFEDYNANSEDEAVRRMTLRHETAPQFFIGGFLNNKLVGFVSACLPEKPHLTEDRIIHPSVAGGETVILHRIWVHKDHRMKGFARSLIESLVKTAKAESPQPKRICSVTRDLRVPSMIKLGYTVMKPVKGITVYGNKDTDRYLMEMKLDPNNQQTMEVKAEDVSIRPLQGNEYKDAHIISYEDYYFAFNECLEIYRKRFEDASDLFLGLFIQTKLMGFVQATKSDRPKFEDDQTLNHVPGGEAVLLHRVWVHKSCRRQGYAKKLMEALVEAARKETPHPKRICCATEDVKVQYLVPLGFTPTERMVDKTLYPKETDFYLMEMWLGPEEKEIIRIDQSDITIRPLQGDEFKVAHTICYEDYQHDYSYWLEKLGNMFKQIPRLHLGMFCKSRLIGFLQASLSDKPQYNDIDIFVSVPGGETVLLHRIWINKDYRKQGLAKKFMAAFIEAALKENAKRICCATRDWRIPLLLKFGFTAMDLLKDPQIYPQGIDFYRMEMKIGAEKNQPTEVQANDVSIRPLQGTEYKDAHIISMEDFTPSIYAKCLEVAKQHFEMAPHLFLGLFVNDRIVGYIQATKSDRPQFEEDQIFNHVPGGETVYLHRVWVHKYHRNQGYAKKLFDALEKAAVQETQLAKRICSCATGNEVPPLVKCGLTPMEYMKDTKIYPKEKDFYRMEKIIGQEEKQVTQIKAEDITIRPLQGREYKHATVISTEDYSNAGEVGVNNMKIRSEIAPHLMLGCFVSDKLIGYISGTQSDKPEFTLDSMTKNVPGGETVCVMRIWVHKYFRKQGIGSKILDAFRKTVLSLDPKPKRICCGVRESRVAPFLRFGFQLVDLMADNSQYNTYMNSFRMEMQLDTREKSQVLKDLENATFRVFEEKDCISAWMLEAYSYPSDEAASLATIKYRFKNAPHLCVGYFAGSEMIGSVHATQSDQATLTTESLAKHVPNGETVCIHSVCVKEDYRRKGIASTMLKSYIDCVKKLTPKPKRICLVAHDYLIPLYTKNGFTQTGVADFKWGSCVWYGLEYKLD